MSLRRASWSKVLLAGGLALLAAQGVIRLPEVENRWLPDRVKQREMARIVSECEKIRQQVNSLQEDLKFLEMQAAPDPYGIPVRQSSSGGSKALASLNRISLFLLGELVWTGETASIRLSLAKKALVSITRKLQYINAVAATVPWSWCESDGDTGITPALPLALQRLSRDLGEFNLRRQEMAAHVHRLEFLLTQYPTFTLANDAPPQEARDHPMPIKVFMRAPAAPGVMN